MVTVVAGGRKVARLWTDFWFRVVPVQRTALFRIAVAGFALVDALFFATFVHRYSGVDALFARPVHLFRIFEPFGFWQVGGLTLVVLHVVMVLCLLAATLGYRTRGALLLGGLLYLHHFALFNSWGKVNHGKITVIVALLALVMSRCGHAYSLDSLFARARRSRAGDGTGGPRSMTDEFGGWSLRVVTVWIVLAYAISAYAKLTNTGWDWALEPILAVSLLESDAWVARFLIANPVVLQIAQALTLVLEATAWCSLFVGGRIRNVILAGLAVFHLGSYALLRTEFLGWIVTYLAFYRLESAADVQVVRRVRRVAPSRRLAVAFDPKDTEARSVVTALRCLDVRRRLRSSPIGVGPRPGQGMTGIALARSLPSVAALLVFSWLPGGPPAWSILRQGRVQVRRLPVEPEPEARTLSPA